MDNNQKPTDSDTICLVIPRAMNLMLLAIASDMGVSRSDCIRFAVREWISADEGRKTIADAFVKIEGATVK